MAEQGFRLIIPDDMVRKLQIADEKVEKLAKTSEQASTSIVNAFKTMANDGVDAFIQKLNEAQQAFSKIGKFDGGSINLGNISFEATNSADAINKLVDSITRLIDENKRLQSQQLSSRGISIAQEGQLSTRESNLIYKNLSNDLKELHNLEMQRGRELQRQNRENIANEKILNEQLKTSTMLAITKEKKRQVELKRSLNEINRLAKAYKQLPTMLSTKAVGKLVAGSVQSKSINQMLTSIQNLKNAKKDLDTTDRRYAQTLAKINSEIERQKNELAKLGVNIDNVNQKHRGLLNIGEQLSRRLALVFSVSQITGYINKMIQVRGEFELQQRSLQAILQNKDEANKLWQQTIDLAVRSPFRVKELVTYTKQLAAYRIETHKLHDTTKMLADISAGLGVDMNRLILAYGQVKAANYLRGCLGYGTLIKLYNGDEKEVQNIVVGDILMGDDGGPRYVKEIIRGSEMMYIVHQWDNGCDYRVNENHILTLYDLYKHKIVDVYVKDYLYNPKRYLGVKRLENGEKDTYPISIEKNKRDKYYGFVIDGNKRFLLGDGTITHNTELRQFSEAGVNILGELATYFSEIEGKAISVGEVFERVSKRMVTFYDVEEVFERITSKGGTFYRMQEIQSETLRGLVSNLKDSIDLMVNEIGESADSSLKSLLGIVKSLIENWRAMAVVLKQVGFVMAGMGVIKFASGWKMVAKEGAAAAMAMNGLAGAGARMNVTLKSIGSTIAKHPILMLVGVLASAAHSLYEYGNSISETNKKYDDASDSAYNLREDFLKLTTQINNNNKSIVAAKDSISKLSEGTNEYNVQKEKLNNLEKVSDELYLKLQNKYPDIISSISLQKDKTIELANAVDLYNKKTTHQIALNEQGKGGWFRDDIKTNYNDLLDTQAEINSAITKLQSATASSLTQTDRFKGVLDDDTFNNIVRLSENVLNATEDNIIYARYELESFIRSTKSIELKKIFHLDEFTSEMKGVGSALVEYSKDWKNFEANLKRMLPTFQSAARSLQFDTDEQRKQSGDYFNSLLDGLGIVDEKVKKLTQQWLEAQLGLQGKIDWSGYNIFSDSITHITEDEQQKMSQILAQRIDVIKDLNSSYKELGRTFDDIESKERVINSYKDTVNPLFEELGININDIQFDSIEGVIEALKKLLPTVKEGTSDWIKLNKVISEFGTKKDVDIKAANDKELLKQIEEMFSGYEISLELQKLNIPPDLASQIFNIKSFTLPELKTELLKLQPQFKGKGMLDEWNKLMKRINDMENKAQQERLKTYTKYLVKAQSERVKIKLEELRQIAEVEKESAYSEEQKSIIKQGIQDEAQKKLDKQDWLDFKDTTLYIQMFDDLEYVSTQALESMQEKLVELRGSLKNLEPSELKEIQSRLSEINDELVKRNPLKNFGSNLLDGINALRQMEEQQAKVSQAQKEEDEAKALVDTLTLQVEEERKLNKEQEKGFEYQENGLETSEQLLESAIERYAALKGITKQEAKQLLLLQQQVTTSNKTLNNIGEEGSGIMGTIGGVVDMLDNFGLSVDESFKDALSGVSQIFNGLANIDITNPISVIKGVVESLIGVGNIIAALWDKNNDAWREEQIERETKLIAKLEKQYESLQEKIQEAYSISTLESANSWAKSNLKQQIAATERMIKLEQDKKETDSEKINSWKNDIEEMNRTLKELEEERLVALGGLGSEEAYKSAAQEFVSAWIEAYKEAGNGLSALDDQFNQFFNDMISKQLMMRGVEKFLAPFFKEFDSMFDDTGLGGGLATKEELDAIKEMWAKTSPELNDFLNGLVDSLGIASDLTSSTSDLSGLQKWISSITKSQADIISSYLNSMRFFVADSNSKLTELLNSFTNSSSPNPILAQLRIIAQQTTAIRTLLDNLLTSHPIGGRGLKVVL